MLKRGKYNKSRMNLKSLFFTNWEKQFKLNSRAATVTYNIHNGIQDCTSIDSNIHFLYKTLADVIEYNRK